MASSSSSSPASHSTAASSSQSWKYDVFLSFRGEDTRKTFVDHLYSTLDQQRIYTYKDDVTLPRGESIGPSLLKAIEESQIAVIVFSKNYADSSWCLDELAYIMKCRDERGQTVIPIFYHVLPSEVRNRKGEFGEAFAKQESKNNSKVESWRKALVDAAGISGCEPEHMANGHESACIKEIVDKISHKLLPLTSSADTNLIGMETRVQQLKSLLEIESGDVRMVGIWGLGGSGKTTVAYSLYKKISSNFVGRCFVENIREESIKNGLEKLQQQILSDVSGYVGKVSNISEGRDLIKRRLCHTRVLIILDDVDSHQQLEALAGSHDWFGVGSRIIITTRDDNLLKAHRVNIIHVVSLLTCHEAIQLFSWHAFKPRSPVNGFEKLSEDMVSRAGGLPLALKVLGSFLCGKDKDEWISALARLKEIPDGRILEKLKISYDGLQREEKELFLDIACLFRWWGKDEVMQMLDACGFHPVIGVKVLIEKALITISDVGSFDMHDLVQEMGHYIVRGEHPNNPEKHSRVWRDEDGLKMCTRDAITENDKVEALALRFFGSPDKDPAPGFFELVANMKKLRLLHVSYDRFGATDKARIKAPKSFSNELRWFHWYGYPASSLPTNFQPTELRGLTLEFGLQKQLWKGYKHLPSLKVLNLQSSRYLIRTPDFDGLPNLETLDLSRCSHLNEVHPSIGNLERLVYLNLEDCYELKMFPPIIQMKKLKTFILRNCGNLRKFPEIQQKMDSLEDLSLDWSGIEVIPSSIGQYCTDLVSISLNDCSRLKRIEGNFHLLKRLKVLYLWGCTRFGVEKLPLPPNRQLPSSQHPIMKPLKNRMRRVRLQNFHRDLKFPHLPQFLGKLALPDGNLVNGDIHLDIGEVSNLEALYLGENLFSRLRLSQLPRLKRLHLSKCKNLVELPELPSSIAILDAEECSSLEVVGGLPNNCKWLWKVSLMWNPKQRLIGGDRVLQSMLLGNAVENHFISLKFQGLKIPKEFEHSLLRGNKFTLQLPQNWYNEFKGFLMCTADNGGCCYLGTLEIFIDEEMALDSPYELWRESYEAPEARHYGVTHVGYVPFSLLRHTTWWNSTHNTISFSFCSRLVDSIGGCGVELFPEKNRGDPTETAKTAPIDCSEFWDKQSRLKTFEIQHDSNSTLKISWNR